MRKVIIFLLALVTVTVTTPAFAAKRSIMELPLFERAVLIIKNLRQAPPQKLDIRWIWTSGAAERTIS